MNRNLIIGLDCLLDRRLLAVQKLLREDSNDSPLELGLVFEEEFYGTFLCESDGTLSFFGDSISPLLMGDYGDYIVEDVFNDPTFSPVVGSHLTAAYLIESDSVLVGVKFVFGKLGLNILNIGNQLRAFSKIPQSVRNEGKYRLLPLR